MPLLKPHFTTKFEYLCQFDHSAIVLWVHMEVRDRDARGTRQGVTIHRNYTENNVRRQDHFRTQTRPHGGN